MSIGTGRSEQRCIWSAGGYGALQLASPTLVSRSLLRGRLDTRGQGAARVLGARQLTQALASGPVPNYPVVALGVEVDLLHAASMLALAVTGRRRWAAFTDALIAGAFAAAGASPPARQRTSRHGDRPTPCRNSAGDGRTASLRRVFPATQHLGASQAHGTARSRTGFAQGHHPAIRSQHKR